MTDSASENNFYILEGRSKRSSSWNQDVEVANHDLTHRRASEQRFCSKHTRHLPSRTLAFLSNTENSKLHLVQPYKTLRLIKDDQLQIDKHVENIANHIELQEELMHDDPLSEMRRIEALRDMPECLTVKRSIKAKLSQSIHFKSRKKVLSRWKRFKYTFSIFFIKVMIGFKNFLSNFEIWYNSIKSIEGHFGSGVATYFKFLRWLFLLNVISCFLSLLFIIIPQSMIEAFSAPLVFNFDDLFIGQGFMNNTILYYGFYSNHSLEIISGYKYNVPSAYIITMLCCYLLIFILLSIKVSKSYRKCFIETSGGIHNLYANKIFCGWDYNITSYKAASLRSSSIYRELKELLAETDTCNDSSCLARFYKFFIQFIVNCLVIMAIIGTGVLIWTLLNSHKPEKTNLLSLLTIPLVITIITSIFPVIISQLVKIENYKNKRNALFVTMIRIYSMTVIVIGTLLVYWLSYGMINCWQTELAQEIYRLIIFDFLIFIIGSFIVEAVYYYIYSIVWKNIGAPKFDIAINTLNLIYNQILLWVALYFSPLLSIVSVVKIFLTFYIKKYGLMRHCEPPVTPWRAAQTQTLFLVLTFLGMTGSLMMLGYVITNVKCNDCGPFQNYNYTWEVMVEHVLELQRDSKTWEIITSLAKPGVGAAILIAMSVTVYCFRSKAEASKQMVGILREMLVLQSRDKDFLLNEFSKVADENWLQRRTAFNESRISNIDTPKECPHTSFKSRSISMITNDDSTRKTETSVNSTPSCSKNYVTFDYS
ncbi:transmembrane channel-like protein 5 isoform X1 [Microplitis mediator]|uniref:transmembrane channel-like protein 5 isoform X1 n=1 Tax=Microplitis mediator TaxID=375433 RepID=UPI00255413F5|nr:transmembrane channel-like protein 5 isoform X1 [Microplitis mediator]